MSTTVTTVEMLEAVKVAMAEVGLGGGVIEYPGFIAIYSPDDGAWAFGTANGTWGGQFSRGDDVLGGFDTYLVPETPAHLVATALYAGFMEADYED